MIFPSLSWMSPRLLPGPAFAGCPCCSVISFCGLFKSFAVLLPFLFSRCSNIYPSRCFPLFTCFLYVVASSDTIEKVRRHRQMKRRPENPQNEPFGFAKEPWMPEQTLEPHSAQHYCCWFTLGKSRCRVTYALPPVHI